MKSSRENQRRALPNHIETEWLPGPSKTGLKILTNLKKEQAHPWKHRKERTRKTTVGGDHPSSVQSTGHLVKWTLNVTVSLARELPIIDMASASCQALKPLNSQDHIIKNLFA